MPEVTADLGITFLNDSSVDGTLFIGATLWTDFMVRPRPSATSGQRVNEF
jgi:hypothetical protein